MGIYVVYLIFLGMFENCIFLYVYQILSVRLSFILKIVVGKYYIKCLREN